MIIIKEQLLREKLIAYVEKNGIKYNFIANKLNINKGTLSHFVKGIRPTPKYVFELVEQYLEKIDK